MTIKIGNINMPTDMANRGLNYAFQTPATVARNGLGDAVTAGGHRLEWTWATLSVSEWNWLVTTVLQGGASRRFTSSTTTLLNDLGVEQSFSSCIVLRPIYQAFTGLYYRNVTLVIEQLF
ncbi:MAG: hypothetical protein M9927_26015 [Anaerolineae bacterium]|nr:hypothetical protein [Anaerolineae bacterium]